MARLHTPVVGIAFALLACGVLATQVQPQPLRAPSLGDADAATIVEASVTRAVDGNALDAHVEGSRTLVGYLGAETPARNQPCGQEAMVRSEELAGRHLYLETDPAHLFDARGRRLYYAYTSDGASIDEALIREGLAQAVRTDARYGAYLAMIQAEAEAEGRGCLWRGEGDP